MSPLLFAAMLAQATPAPSLSVSTSTVNLNPAQQQVVTVTGAAPPLQATLDQRLVNVSVSPDSSSVTITATQATGDDTLHLIDANGARADIAIKVAFNAGTIQPQSTLTVTGDSIDPAWLAQEVARHVTRITQAQPGASVTIGSIDTPANPLVPGQSAQLSVPVQINGNGRYFDQSGTTTVSVQDVAMPAFDPLVLFYDDDPEHVTQDGVLFRGTVNASAPTRLYYYHDAAQDPRRLVVALTTTAQEPTSVHLVEAQAGPNMDVMHVGHTVTKNFLLTKMRGLGSVVTLPQGQPFLLADVPMASRQLVSGTVDIRVLSGGPVTVTVLGVSGDEDPRTMLAGPILPDDGHHRTGVFQINNFGSNSLNYSIGSADPAAVVIGDTDPTPPSAQPNAEGHDYGDYGVLHTINLTVNNPSPDPATAYLYFKPLGGPARGSFLVDGSLYEIGCVRVSQPYQISEIQIAAGQTYHGTLRTMTDGGSFYPAEIGITTTPPQPHAPPINAPDGCFPKPQADTSQ